MLTAWDKVVEGLTHPGHAARFHGQRPTDDTSIRFQRPSER
jgi:hypothetical protein